MKKIRIYSELALMIALIILALGVVFVIKAGFGMTIVQAPVYVLSLALPSLTIGVWNYIVQGSLFIIMLLILKQFKIGYIVSFISAFIYGLILDGFTYLLRDLTADTLIMAVIFYIIGFILLCISVTIFFTCKAPLMPYDIFIREVAVAKGIGIPKFKWGFDITCLSIAMIISYSIRGTILGLGWGTVIFALFVSPIMAQLIKFVNRYVVYIPLIKDKTYTFGKRQKF